MCGIFAWLDPNNPSAIVADLVKELSHRMTTRGPDETGFVEGKGWALAHERLSIMDPEHGHQPFCFTEDKIWAVANGEIYNHKDLFAKLEADGHKVHKIAKSDCEVIPHLYKAYGNDFVKMLDGMFGLCIVAEDGKKMFAARDPVGIKPLYYGKGDNGKFLVASELKSIVDQCPFVEIFPAGHYYTHETGFVKYFNPEWDDDNYIGTPPEDFRKILERAVVKRMMSDVPYGLLLSGGIDSSVVAALMRPHIKELHSFAVGQEGSPDITAAREVSQHFGTIHHERIFTSEEAFKIIPKVIYHLETYETELIRSSIPNFFLAEMTSKHVKMVITGEGSDEIFAGYLYFRDAPNAKMLQKECRRIYHHLQSVNLQRADRMTMAHGLEARVPFLDTEVLQAGFSIDPALKMIQKTESGDYKEKMFLRNLFKDDLPEPVLMRTKAMQCEGVGTNWVADLQKFCNDAISDAEFESGKARYPHNPPHTKEELYYRDIFQKHFPNQDKFVHVWEGGCRAGGAPWGSQTYTREGLANTEWLKHSLMEKHTKNSEEQV